MIVPMLKEVAFEDLVVPPSVPFCVKLYSNLKFYKDFEL